jgi:hypothetical protein
MERYVPTLHDQEVYHKIEESFFKSLNALSMQVWNAVAGTPQDRDEFMFYCGWLRALAWERGLPFGRKEEIILECPDLRECKICSRCGRCQYHGRPCVGEEEPSVRTVG